MCYKKTVIITLFMILMLSASGCSAQKQDQTEQPESNISLNQSLAEPQASSETQDSDTDTNNDVGVEEENSPLVGAVNSLISQYEAGTIDTETGLPGSPGPTFNPMPDDFVFPEIKSEADFEAISEIRGSNMVIVYVKGTGEYPYMNIRIDRDNNYDVVSVLFMQSMPD